MKEDEEIGKIAAKSIENFVWSYIEKAINKPEEFLRVHKSQTEAHEEKKANLTQDLRLYEESLTKANERIERVQDDFYGGHIDDAKRQEHLAKYEEQRDDVFQKKQKIEAEIIRLGRYDIACEHLLSFSAKFKQGVKDLGYAEKKKLVEMLVERIEVYDTENERRARVCFRFDPKEVTDAIPRVEPPRQKFSLKTLNAPKTSQNSMMVVGAKGFEPLTYSV